MGPDTQSTTDPVPRALTKAHEQEGLSISHLSEVIATSNANADPNSSLIANSSSSLIANPMSSLFANPGSSLIAHLGLSSIFGPHSSLGVNPTTVPLVTPLLEPPTV